MEIFNQAVREHGTSHTTLKDRLCGRVEHGKKSVPMPYLPTFLTEAFNIRYGNT